jgi:hypothetical protein
MSMSYWIGGLVVLAVVGLLLWFSLRGARRSEADAREAKEPASTVAHAESLPPARIEDDPFSLGGRAAPAPLGRAPAQHKVEASALVPRSVARSEVFRVEAVLARVGSMTRALTELQAGRDELVSVPSRKLTASVGVGTVIELTLECAQADLVVPKVQSLQWIGTPLTAGFQIRLPAGMPERNLFADINVFVDRVCVGHLPLTLPVVERPDPADATLVPTSTSFEIPHRLFMSYTKDDRAYVLPIARALKEIGVEAFMDRLSLEGGEDWESRLWREIDACDCFMLFWSKESAASEWVQRETLRALQRQREGPHRRPKIVTHLLGKPPPAAPPPALAGLHFNDPAYAIWEAALAAGEA